MSFIKKIINFIQILITFDLISNIKNSAYVRYNRSFISIALFAIKFTIENIAFIWKISSSGNKVAPRKKSNNFQANKYRNMGQKKGRNYSYAKRSRKSDNSNKNLTPLGYIFNRKVFYTAFMSILILGSVFIGYGFLTNTSDVFDKNNFDTEKEYNNGNRYSGLSLNFDEQIKTEPIEKRQIENTPTVEHNRNLENILDIIVIEEGAEDIIEEGMPEEKDDKVVEYINYKIKSGDTISALALKHGVSDDAIFSANVNVNSKALKIGDTLRIPNKNGLTYKIRRNDTLSDIAVLFDTSVAKIVEENRLKNSIIHPDTELFITSGRLTEEAKLRILGIELINPVRGRLTSKYGFRVHPIHKTKLHHNGIDIGGNGGQNVIAAQSGKVTFAGWSGGYGYQIKIQHRNGLVTTYAHLASMSVKRGQNVNRGQTIGKVGSTGNVTGAHLHFEVLLNGKFVNPRLYVTY